MATADCYYVCEQLEDPVDVHRLLPLEILCRSHAVVEELAARLVGILGLTGHGGVGDKRAAATSPPPPASATPYSHPDAEYRSHVVREQLLAAGAGGNGRSGGTVQYHHYHAPGFGTKQWLRPPRPTTFVPPPASCGGTGVFLPRADVYPTRASNPPRINGTKPPRLLRKEAAMETVRNKMNRI
ncbi:hypothetical protein E2562_021694 [Oryza meyeriana var. granulata]|uniref:Uncharacterized protein n=1 Tax=Oryza meyeriana var. granulata TaxID=110450 RepID=A0A6G1DZP9_9ORYZ|nr:hypothetical protein E2562_021694 [Oryza meyeriana var. granulata]